MQLFLCEVAYAVGEKSGSWTSIAVHAEIEDHLAEADDLEYRLLGKAREESDPMVDERASQNIAFVWLLSYEWIGPVEEETG